MNAPRVPAGPRLLVPEGTRLLHIGPHKTGTTALQAALYAARPAMRAQGVGHAGASRNPSNAVHAITGRRAPYSDGEPPPLRHWRSLVREVHRAREPRLVLSSEFFAWAEPDAVRRIVDDLGPGRVAVVVTLRPLARILPSHWQQNVQAGYVAPYSKWLDTIFNVPAGRPRPGFWQLQRHDELIARWAEVVGPERVTAIVLDDRDHGIVLRTFEQLLGLRDGTLVAVGDLANRSLTLPEVEAIRAFNRAFKHQQLGRATHARVMRFGAAQMMKQRRPPPDEPRIETPQWALDRATDVAREMVATIATSGVCVVGDLDGLAAPQQSPLDGDELPDTLVAPEVAASMAMGVFVATGAARRAAADAGRRAHAAGPLELARVPSDLVLGVIAGRARRTVAGRLRRLTGRRG